ncbi:Fc.00g025930.m01.CDS01 [Cosmosporella sp. VM-42]
MPDFTSYPITGITVGGVQLRREVNDWALNNPIQLSLFIRAMRIFQAMDFQERLSYFQVAGIHGLPAIPWDNDPAPMEVTNSYPGTYAQVDVTPDFYCSHQSLIFPTWHRAYMLLFEQRLWEIMNTQVLPEIPSSFQAQWQKMADTWRMPYWDWAASPEVPLILLQDTISIVEPDGSSSVGLNPLYKFSTANISTFQQPPASVPVLGDQKSFGQWAIFGDHPLSATSGTSRWGVNGTDAGVTAEEAAGIENNDLVNQALQDPQWTLVGHAGDLSGSIKDQVSRLFLPSTFDNYAEFATTAHGDQGPAGWLSIELIHNCIHDWVGGVGYTTQPSIQGGVPQDPPNKYGYGHMADLGVAAFDPIFWLHHCNVDRQLAIYQLNNGKGQWFTGAGPNDPTETDPMYPFHSDTNFTHYNSDTVQDWTKLGYNYDDLTPTNPSSGLLVSPEELQKRLTEKYGVLRRVISKVSSERKMEGLDNDYLINTLYNRFAFSGSGYIIHFFIGALSDIPSSPLDYKQSHSHVGSIHTFSANYWTRGNKNGIKCDNCNKQQNKNQLSKGQIPVTLQLLQRAASDDEKWETISHLGKQHVVEYLRESLQWRVVSVSGELIDTAELSDLKVFFAAGSAEHPGDPAKPSRFFDYSHHWEVTKDKVGGARPE